MAILSREQCRSIVQHVNAEISINGYFEIWTLGPYMKKHVPGSPDWMQFRKHDNQTIQDWFAETFPLFSVAFDSSVNAYVAKKKGTPPPAPVPAPAPVPPSPPPYPESRKQALRDFLLKSLEQNNNKCKCAALGSAFPDWKQYRFPNELLKDFIVRTLPEFDADELIHNGQHGDYYIYLLKPGDIPSKRKKELREFLLNTLAQNNNICKCALLGSKFPDWKNYRLPNELFKDLIIRNLPEFAAAELTANGQHGDYYIFLPNYQPEYAKLISPFFVIPDETALEKAAAVFNSASPKNQKAKWSGELVEVIAENVLGLRRDVLEDMSAGAPRLAVPLPTQNNDPVYAVLVPNSSEAGAKWVFSGFAMPGEPDRNGYGEWLRSHFNMPTKDRRHYFEVVAKIAEQSERMQKFRSQMETYADSVASIIRNGEPFPKEFADAFTEYKKCWTDIVRLLKTINADTDEQLSLEYLARVTDPKDSLRTQINSATEAFIELSGAVMQFFCEKTDEGNPQQDLSAEDAPVPETQRPDPAWLKEDRARWQAAAAAEPAAIGEMQALLADYRLIAEMCRDFSGINDESVLQLNLHFGTALTKNDALIKLYLPAQKAEAASGEDAGRLAFLKNVEIIDKCLRLVENSMQSEHYDDTKAETVYPEGAELLQAVIDGKMPFGAIFAQYPAPDEEETSVIRCEQAVIQSILQQDSDDDGQQNDQRELAASLHYEPHPYAIASTLYVVYGLEKAALLEEYLLCALALGERKSVNLLSSIYTAQERLPELLLLYRTYCKSSELLPDEHAKTVRCLCMHNMLGIEEALGDYYPVFLEPDMLEWAETCNHDCAERLIDIGGIIRSDPFVKALAMQNSEQLAEYASEPQKLAALEDIGITRPAETIGRMLRSNRYHKGYSVPETAWRIFEIIGNWKDIVTMLLSLLEENEDIRALRLKVADEAEDIGTMLAILQADESLREKNRPLYVDLLFISEHYREFLNEADETASGIRRLIAESTLGEWDGSVPDLTDSEPEELLTLCRLPDEIRSQIADAFAARSEYCAAYIVAADAQANSRAQEAGGETYALLVSSCDAEDPAPLMKRAEFFLNRFDDTRCAEILERFFRFGLTNDSSAALLFVLDYARKRFFDMELLPIIHECGKGEWICQMPDLCERLNDYCLAHKQIVPLLRFLHINREQAADEIKELLLIAYDTALEQDVFPSELLDEAEETAFSMLADRRDPITASFCVYRFEMLKQNQLRAATALNFLLVNMEHCTDETAARINKEAREHPELSYEDEFKIFEQVLTASDDSIIDYVHFCALLSTQEAADEDNAILAALFASKRSFATDRESAAILRALYRDEKNVEKWRQLRMLSLVNRPDLYCKLLLAVHDEMPEAIKASECVKYCKDYKDYETLLDALVRWTEIPEEKKEKKVEWFYYKEHFVTLMDIIRPEVPKEWLQYTDKLHTLLIHLTDIIRRILISETGDDNYRMISNIIEYAVAVKMEDTACDLLSQQLLGAYRNQYFALVLRLILTGDLERIRKTDSYLSQIDRVNPKPFPWLVAELREKTPEERLAWSKSALGAEIIEAILPNGHRPTDKAICRIIMRHITDRTFAAGIEVLELFLQDGADVMLYNGVFILAKYLGPDALPHLFSSLHNLLFYYPMDENGKERTYLFTRKRVELLCLVLILRVIAERENKTDCIPAGIREQTLNDYLHAVYNRCTSLRSYNQAENPKKTNAPVNETFDSFYDYYGKFYNDINMIYDGSDKSLTTAALLATVTGNWEDYLMRVWKEKRDNRRECDPHFAITCAGGRTVGNYGMRRSAFLVLKALPAEERSDFIEWLDPAEGDSNSCKYLSNICLDLRNALPSSKSLYRFYNLDTLNSLDSDSIGLLELPWEERLVCTGSDEPDPDEPLTSCLGWLRSYRTPFSATRTAANLAVKLSIDLKIRIYTVNYAYQLFRSNDPAAVLYYDMLSAFMCSSQFHRIMMNNRDIPSNIEHVNRSREYYQAMYRMSCMLLDASDFDKENSKTSLMNIRPHSVFNIVISLCNEQRGSRIHFFASLLHGQNRELALNILRLLDPNVSDEEKLAVREKYASANKRYEIAAIGIAGLLALTGRSPQNPSGEMQNAPENPLFLHSAVLCKQMSALYAGIGSAEKKSMLIMPRRSFRAAELIQSEPEPEPEILEDEIPLTDSEAVNEPAPESTEPDASAQEIPDDGQDFASVQEIPDDKQDFSAPKQLESPLPDFAMDYQGSFSGSSAGTSWRMLEQMYLHKYPDSLAPESEHRKERMQDSADVFAAASMAPDTTDADLCGPLIRFGLDYYRFSEEDNPEAAEKAIRELAYWCSGHCPKHEAVKMLLDVLPGFIISSLLRRKTLNALTDHLSRLRVYYDAMTSLIQGDEKIYAFLTQLLESLYRMIRELEREMKFSAEHNEDALKSIYSGCMGELYALALPNSYFSTSLSNLRNHFVQLLMLSMNDLDRRPALKLTILNVNGEGLRKGTVFGMLENKGRASAENIQLIASWQDSSMPNPTTSSYSYPLLKPRESALIAVDYDASEVASSVSYTFSGSAVGQGEDITISPVAGRLEIVENPDISELKDKAALIYNPDDPANFEIVDNAIVSINGFFGRQSQITELKSCLLGDRFNRYQSRLLVGIKRAGKSSILHYFINYCKLERPNIFCCDVDIQGLMKNEPVPIYKAFIAPVLNEMSHRISDSEEWPEWQKFKETWSAEQIAGTPEKTDIYEFFNDLTRFFAKHAERIGRQGVMLVIDEFDKLIDKIGENAFSDLLETLRAIIGKNESCIRFVFSASNMLLMEQYQGGLAHQFFHSIGITKVDELPAADMGELILTPCKEYPIVIPDITIDWIYRYTSGLVWYVKMLCREGLKHAAAAGRNIIYPYDIFIAFIGADNVNGVCSDAFCKQLFDGCNDDMYRVIEAMANLSVHYDAKISHAKLSSELGDRFKDKETGLRDAINRLKDLRILDQVNNGYCFRKEIYRRYFRAYFKVKNVETEDAFSAEQSFERESTSLYSLYV